MRPAIEYFCPILALVEYRIETDEGIRIPGSGRPCQLIVLQAHVDVGKRSWMIIVVR
jgi:hypothetical protein